jgi:hypothetical protein
MHFAYALPSYLHFSREVWIAAGIGFVVALGVMALLVWAGKRRFVVIGGSPAVDVIAYHLGRIADTLDHLSTQPASPLRGFERARQSIEAERGIEPSHQLRHVESAQNPVREQPKVPSYRVGMSIFGR